MKMAESSPKGKKTIWLNVLQKSKNGFVWKRFKPLQNDKILDWSKFNAICRQQNNCELKIEICFWNGRKQTLQTNVLLGKREK